MGMTRIASRPSPSAWLLAAVAGLVALAALLVATGSATPSAAANDGEQPKPTVVLVHGAWADASGWSDVVRRLQQHGYPVIAPATPLRSLAGDAAYLASILAQTPGPLVVVGHSYGGAVITNAAAGNTNVKALVYVDAFIPDLGEDILHLAGAGSQIPASIEFKGYPPFGATDVDVYLRADMFRETFAGDVSAKEAAVMAAGQRPLALAAGAEPTTATAWSTIPSWALVGLEDKAITPEQQLFMARRAGSEIVQINSSHVPMISHPNAVTKLIETAVAATS